MMMRRLQQITAVLVIAQGAGHTFLGTPALYSAISQDMVWFGGAGLAMMFLGLLNLEERAAASAWRRWSVCVANLLWLALMLALLATSTSWRVVAAAVFSLVLLLASLSSAVTARGPRRQSP